MKTRNLKDIAETVGIAAIIASLIFVGLQMKQSHEIALAAQYQARAEATMNLTLAHMEADYLPPIPPLRAGLSEEVSARDINTQLWLWIAMDNHYFQYQSGFLSEESWQAQWRNTQAIYTQCELRFVYDWRKEGLRSEFVELLASLEDPCTTQN